MTLSFHVTNAMVLLTRVTVHLKKLTIYEKFTKKKKKNDRKSATVTAPLKWYSNGTLPQLLYHLHIDSLHPWTTSTLYSNPVTSDSSWQIATHTTCPTLSTSDSCETICIEKCTLVTLFLNFEEIWEDTAPFLLLLRGYSKIGHLALLCKETVFLRFFQIPKHKIVNRCSLGLLKYRHFNNILGMSLPYKANHKKRMNIKGNQIYYSITLPDFN